MPLKIILLLDSFTLQAWEFEVLRSVLRSGNGQFIACGMNQSPKTSGTKSPFIYRLYRWIDRKLFLKTPDAFANKDFNELRLENLILIPVNPIQSKYSDSFSQDSLDKIKVLNPDLILRFGFRILKGEILNLSRLGVWSFHHGDPAFYRGGPPAFWEVMKQRPITSAVLMRINEKLDQGEILYQTFTQTDPLSVQRNANKLFWASSSFVARVISEIEQIGFESWKSKVQKQDNPIKAPLWKPPGSLPMLQMLGNLVSRNINRKIKELRKGAHWQIGKVPDLPNMDKVQFDSEQVELWEHPDPKRYYLADPFNIKFEEKEYVFAEEFDKQKRKGRIVYINKGLGDIQVKTVIEEDWHLSFPFVWKENGRFYMIPESADSGKIFWYEALDFPMNWEKKGILFDKEGYDPILMKKDGLYWLFINQRTYPACSPFDELFLFWTADFKNPNWQAHTQNPIVSDVRKSRPAGKLYQKDGVWYRPSQDSGLRYGHQVHIQEIEIWNKEKYFEKRVQTIEPGSQALGIHTFNQGDLGNWVDFYSRK